jgi:hypothetical protein
MPTRNHGFNLQQQTLGLPCPTRSTRGSGSCPVPLYMHASFGYLSTWSDSRNGHFCAVRYFLEPRSGVAMMEDQEVALCCL